MSEYPHDRAATAPTCVVRAGETVGRWFTLNGLLDWGGQALIWRVTDRRDPQRRLVLKIARSEPTLADEANLVLQWEATLLRRLRHPALPLLVSTGQLRGSRWFVRDEIIGTPLHEELRRAVSSSALVQQRLVQIAGLLQYLHRCDPPVIAGDLKPANLVIRPDGLAVLIDLGSAQTLTRRPPLRARPRHGTPGYAAPEQLAGLPIDERSDLYSLAVIGYEMLTGDDPCQAPLQYDVARLRRSAPRLAALIERGLQAEPAQRWPNAAALRAALGTTLPPPPLVLPLAHVRSRAELAGTLLSHPAAVTRAWHDGSLLAWIAGHPRPELAQLLHELRDVQRRSAALPPADALTAALQSGPAPARVQIEPLQLDFGATTLTQTHWPGPPQRLTLTNPGTQPLPWQIEVPLQAGVALRVQRNGSWHARAVGMLAPGAAETLTLIVAVPPGPHEGTLLVQCGERRDAVPWRAVGTAGLPFAGGFVRRRQDIDRQADLVAALEPIVRSGRLAAWLRLLHAPELAAAYEVRAAEAHGDALQQRLIAGELAHHLAPQRYPLLALAGLPDHPVGRDGAVPAGSFQLINRSDRAYPLQCRALTDGLLLESGSAELAAHERRSVTWLLNLRRKTHGTARLRISVAALTLDITFVYQPPPLPAWRRALNALVARRARKDS